MKKKLSAILLVLAMCICLAACGDSSSDSDSDNADKKTETDAKDEDKKKEDTAETEKEKVYGVGETWTVDGMFNFAFTSAASTDERNQFDESNPAQVVLLTFDYENLGYKGIMDLYFNDFTVIDESGEVASAYPLTISNYPAETPIGAKCTGAQAAYGLKNASSKITIQIEQYDDKFETYKATFDLTLQ